MKEIPPTAGLPLELLDLITYSADFESKISQFLDVPFVQMVCSGTASLIISLMTFKKLSTRRKVILPAYTCPLVALAVLHCGLIPIVCDLKNNHFDFDPDYLDSLCNDDTLAIIATHLGGRVVNITPVIEIAKKYDIFVIEDAAQALGATWKNKSVCMQGDVGFFSLAAGKGLTTYEGGLLVTRDQKLRNLFLETSKNMIPPKFFLELQRSIELIGYAALYNLKGLYFAYGIKLRQALKKGDIIKAVGDNFSKIIPLHQVGTWRKSVAVNALKRLPAFLDLLTQQAILRLEKLRNISTIHVMLDDPLGEGVWPFFIIIMPTKKSCDNLLRELWTKGLGVTKLYCHVLPDYPCLKDAFQQTDLPHARDFANRMLTISNSPWLGEEDFDIICMHLKNFSSF